MALTLDVLWPDDGSVADEAQVAARVRVERFVDGKTVPVEAAKAAARIAKAIVLRSDAEANGEVAVALQQAEALLTDIGWAAGAQRSTVLRPGYRARVRSLAAALQERGDVEAALAQCIATAIEASPPGRTWQSVFTGGSRPTSARPTAWQPTSIFR